MHVLEKVRASLFKSLFKIKSVGLSKISTGVAFTSSSCIFLSFFHLSNSYKVVSFI